MVEAMILSLNQEDKKKKLLMLRAEIDIVIEKGNEIMLLNVRQTYLHN